MLETIITIILIPFALGAIIFSGAIIAGTVTYLRSLKKN